MNPLALQSLGLAPMPVQIVAQPTSLIAQLVAFTAPPTKREPKPRTCPYAYRLESVAQILSDGCRHSTAEIAKALGISFNCVLKAVHRLCALRRARKAGMIPQGKTRMAMWEATQ